jgi:hypothetical protein
MAQSSVVDDFVNAICGMEEYALVMEGLFFQLGSKTEFAYSAQRGVCTL